MFLTKQFNTKSGLYNTNLFTILGLNSVQLFKVILDRYITLFLNLEVSGELSVIKEGVKLISPSTMNSKLDGDEGRF